MLQVIGADRANSCTLAIDDYVPLSWRCAVQDDVPLPLYWRTGDLDRSPLEIGLVPESGLLHSVTVVSAQGCLCADDGGTAAHMKTAVLHEGLPRCDTRPWLDRIAWPDMRSWEYREGAWMFEQVQGADRFIDEAAPFTVTVSTHGVSLWMGEPVPLVAGYLASSLWCGVGREGSLRLLHFGGLHDNEHARIVATIRGA
jgi:hypothetical protein